MSTQQEHLMRSVLVIEDDCDIGALVQDVLTDEGFVVSLLNGASPESIRATVARIEPDCILLDGENRLGYGSSWIDAAWIAGRDRAVPVIMFTGHAEAVREATERSSGRSREASFAAVLPKPFDIDQLVTTVAQAVAPRPSAPATQRWPTGPGDEGKAAAR